MSLKILSSRRGQGILGEIIFLLVVVFIIGLFWFISNPTFEELNEEMIKSDADLNDSVVSENVNDWFDNRIHKITDGAILFFFIMLGIGVFIAGYFLENHPIFSFAIFGFFVLVSVVTVGISNAWEDISTEEANSVNVVDYPYMDFIFGNYFIVFLANIFLGGIGYLAKRVT